MIYEVLMHVKIDLADDTPENAQRLIENKMNEGEMYEEVCHIFSIRPIPREELPESAYPRKKKPGLCMAPGCPAKAYWLGPQGMSLCSNHYNKIKNPLGVSMGSTVSVPYPVTRLKGYYGPGAEDLTALREAFRRYVEQDAAEHARNVEPEEIERVIDDAVREVLEER